MTTYNTYKLLTDRLEPLYGVDEARAVAHLLLDAKYGITRLNIALNPTAPFTRSDELQNDILRLEQWTPVQYIVGVQEFYGREFAVTPAVLIPRVETEQMVRHIVDRHRHDRSCSILDIGTGSGAIAVTLALEMPQAIVQAWDISAEALDVARHNATRLGAQRVTMLESDALNHQPDSTFDIIVSNPPYVCLGERDDMLANVTAHEPPGALYVPDTDPLRFYRAIAAMPAREIWFEINERFAPQVTALMADNGFDQIQTLQDIHGRDRVVHGTRNI